MSSPAVPQAAPNAEARRAQPVELRIVATGTLELRTAAHFGGGSGDDSDLTILRDGNGDLFIPGASLAGAARAWLGGRVAVEAAVHERARRQNGGQPSRFSPFDRSEEALFWRDLTLLFGSTGRRIDDDTEARMTRRLQEEAGGHYADPVVAAARMAEEREGRPSLLLIDDAYLTPSQSKRGGEVRIRDGVRIDHATGTAAESAKYDFEVLEPDTRFLLRMELAFTARDRGVTRADGRRPEHEERLLGLFDAVLDAFEKERIRIGAKTRRGLGRARVREWQVRRFDFTGGGDRRAALRALSAWLSHDETLLSATNRALPAGAPRPRLYGMPDALLSGQFILGGPLLVRSIPRYGDLPDAVQITSGDSVPVVPGTSLAGVLRHRARRIALSLAYDIVGAHTAALREVNETRKAVEQVVDDQLIDPIFGTRQELAAASAQKDQRAGRLTVDEETIANVKPEVQHRVRIDRFTGGVQHGGLFDEMPVWPRGPGQGEYKVRLRLTGTPPRTDGKPAEGPADHELSLLLHTFRDLWTGDLTAGAGAGVGRGVLRGRSGRLQVRGEEWRWDAPPQEWMDHAPFVFADTESGERFYNRFSDALYGWLHQQLTGQPAPSAPPRPAPPAFPAPSAPQEAAAQPQEVPAADSAQTEPPVVDDMPPVAAPLPETEAGTSTSAVAPSPLDAGQEVDAAGATTGSGPAEAPAGESGDAEEEAV